MIRLCVLHSWRLTTLCFSYPKAFSAQHIHTDGVLISFTTSILVILFLMLCNTAVVLIYKMSVAQDWHVGRGHFLDTLSSSEKSPHIWHLASIVWKIYVEKTLSFASKVMVCQPCTSVAKFTDLSVDLLTHGSQSSDLLNKKKFYRHSSLTCFGLCFPSSNQG